ncbi:MAG: EF-hand domain-containing protein [Bacteroidota bacterium]
MTEIQKSKIDHFFDVLDHNGNGILESEDFELVSEAICDIRKLEKNATERLNLSLKTHSLFVQILKTLNKETMVIRKEEWASFFEKEVLSKPNDYVSLVSTYIFSLFDQDNDGYISKQEYLNMFKAYGMYTATAKKAFDMLDLNGDKKISKGELVKAFEDFFLSSDEKTSGNWLFGDWK